MTRYCSDTTKAKIANVGLSKGTPGWLRAAVQNARHGYPMSEKQELRMLEALGIASPKRASRRFYRPCLSVELGEMVKEYNLDVTAILCAYVAIHIRQKEEDGRIVYYDNTTG